MALGVSPWKPGIMSPQAPEGRQEGTGQFLPPLRGFNVSSLGILDFKDYDQLTERLARLIRKLKAQDVPERSIMVDLTGGQKVTSVAAMATTFDLEISAQCVQTGGKKEAYSYDVISGRPRLDLPGK